MDELIVDGEKYISSKRAARLSGYTKDYIGQMCRAGRIPSKMVGRSWYVKESALKEHRKEYQGAPVVDERLWQEESLGSTFKGFGSGPLPSPKPRLTEEHIKISYEPDPRPLIPTPVVTQREARIEPRSYGKSEAQPDSTVQPIELQKSVPLSEEVKKPVVARDSVRTRFEDYSVESLRQAPPPYPDEEDHGDVKVIEPWVSGRVRRRIEMVLIVLLVVGSGLLLIEEHRELSVGSEGGLEYTNVEFRVWNVFDALMRTIHN